MNPPPTLSVVLSFYNEEANIPELVARLRKVLTALVEKTLLTSYELIFVNDASTDGSRSMLEAMIEQSTDIRLLNMSRNFGVSPCVMAGMKYATGDFVVYMDSDLQDPPELIEYLLRRQAEEGADVIHSVRKSRKGEGYLKLFITRIGYLILHNTTKMRLPIEAGDYKLLSRRATNHVIQFEEKKPFMRGIICWIGFKQSFVYYDRDARHAGNTKFLVLSWAVINNFLESALISFSSAPLRITSFLGLISILFSFALFCHVAFEKLMGRAIPGWTAIMATVIFIGSVQLFSLGIICLYISTIYEEVKRRPNYIVESTCGFDKSSVK